MRVGFLRLTLFYCISMDPFGFKKISLSSLRLFILLRAFHYFFHPKEIFQGFIQTNYFDHPEIRLHS